MPVGTKITKAQSRAYLRKDLARFERCVNDAVTVPINQNQFDALVSLAFNIGEANFEKSSVLRLLNQKNYTGAADAFLRWNKAKKKGVLTVLPGLTRRRKEERALFLKTPVPSSDPSSDRIAEGEPDSVSGGVQGSPGPVAAPPSVSTDKGPDKGIGSVFSDAADALTGALGKAGDVQTGLTKAPFLAALGRWLLTAFSLIATFIYANWEIFLVAVLLAIVILWYLRVVRRRKSDELGTE